jgi:hypothetical protein
LVPMFSCGHLSIHSGGDEFKHPFEACVETMQVQSNAIKI